MVEKLLKVGRYHRSRELPGMTRFGGAYQRKTHNPRMRITLIIPQKSHAIKISVGSAAEFPIASLEKCARWVNLVIGEKGEAAWAGDIENQDCCLKGPQSLIFPAAWTCAWIQAVHDGKPADDTGKKVFFQPTSSNTSMCRKN